MIQFIALFLFLTGSAKAEAEYEISYLKSDNDYFDGVSFKYEDLVELIRSKNILSVDELLPHLPKSMRANFTFIRDSLSLQKTSYLKPRAMMFQPDGKFACTFIDNPLQKGHNSLECYQFRDHTKTFDFREIQFPSSESKSEAALFSQSNVTVDGKVRCTACHGANPRPNWEGYDQWPGVFGKNDDSFEGSPDEMKEYVLFKNNVAKSKRYSKLLFLEKKSDNYTHQPELYPYSSEVRSSYETRPNLRFTEVLMYLVAQRNAETLWRKGINTTVTFNKLYTCDPNISVGARPTAEYLKTITTVFEWTPYFRTLAKDCQECKVDDLAYSDVTHNINLPPETFDYSDGGSARMNYYTTEFLLKKLALVGFFKNKKLNEEILTSNKYFVDTYLSSNSNFRSQYDRLLLTIAPSISLSDRSELCKEYNRFLEK